jgi:hypothetical protein
MNEEGLLVRLPKNLETNQAHDPPRLGLSYLEKGGHTRMPELELCIHCHKPIYDHEQHVIINKHQVSTEDWQYAHAKCYEEKKAATAA